MKHFLRLYVLELRRNRIFALLMFFAHFGLFYYFMYAIELSQYSRQAQIIKDDEFVMIFFMVLIKALPLILYYSFVSTQTYSSNHMLLLLPIQRSMYFTARYCALVSMVVPVVIVYSLLALLPFRTFEFGGLLSLMLPFIPFFFDYFNKAGLTGILHFIAPFALMAGLVCAVESVELLIRRYTAVVRFVFLMVSLIGVIWSMVYFASLFIKLPDFSSRGYNVIRELIIQFVPFVSAYVVVIGLLFLIAGMLVYDRFADV